MELSAQKSPQHSPNAAIRVGVTYSVIQSGYLNLDWRETFQTVRAADWPLMRLGIYWREAEPRPGAFDFSRTDWLLDQCAASGLAVILTVGVKAPRWPEYYLPPWLAEQLAWTARQRRPGARVSDDPRLCDHALRLIDTAIRRYRHHPALSVWQIENEPLDTAQPQFWRLSRAFLAQEVALARRLDPAHPILINAFAPVSPALTVMRSLVYSWLGTAPLATALDLGDLIGLEVYPIVGVRWRGYPLSFDSSRRCWPLLARWRAAARRRGKDAWVVEYQGEPWEPDDVSWRDIRDCRSCDPAIYLRGFRRLLRLGFSTILWWGCEYWTLRAQRQDDRWWRMAHRSQAIARAWPLSPEASPSSPSASPLSP